MVLQSKGKKAKNKKSTPWDIMTGASSAQGDVDAKALRCNCCAKTGRIEAGCRA